MMLGSIQISGSHLSDAQVKDICSSVADHKVPLLTLRKCKTKDKNFKALAKAISRSKALLQLNLNLGLVSSRIRIFSLADALHMNRSITTLLLYGSKLDDKGAIVLCEALAQHPQVVTLDIGNCDLTDISIPHIVKLLPNNGAKPGLHELTLSANKEVTLTGWTQFAMAMAAGCQLRSLYLDYNPLGDHGTSCIAVAVATTKSLKLLDLEACGITISGAQVLLYLLETHVTNISKLVLRGNTISRNVLKDIQALLQQRNRDNRSEQDEESSSSSSDSSLDSDDEQLEQKNIEASTKHEDDVRSSTTALNQFPIWNDHRDETAKDIDQEPEHVATRLRRSESNENPDSRELGSDENESADDQTKAGSSEESHLKAMNGYFDRDHTVYSNLHIQAQQREKEDPPSYKDAVKSLDDAMYSHVMRTSKDGYG